MIDRKARNQFAELLTELLAGRLPAETFDKKMIAVIDNSDEQSLWQIYREFVSRFYSVRTRKADPDGNALTDESKQLGEVVISFLKTDLEYQWGQAPERLAADTPLLLSGALLTITSLGTITIFFVRGPGSAMGWFTATVISGLLTVWVRRRYLRKSIELKAAYDKWCARGDFQVWPYFSNKDGGLM